MQQNCFLKSTSVKNLWHCLIDVDIFSYSSLAVYLDVSFTELMYYYFLKPKAGKQKVKWPTAS